MYCVMKSLNTFFKYPLLIYFINTLEYTLLIFFILHSGEQILKPIHGSITFRLTF